MKILMRAIAKDTNLSAKPEVEDWWPWLKSFVVKAKDTGPGGTEPEKAFRPLFTFMWEVKLHRIEPRHDSLFAPPKDYKRTK